MTAGKGPSPSGFRNFASSRRPSELVLGNLTVSLMAFLGSMNVYGLSNETGAYIGKIVPRAKVVLKLNKDIKSGNTAMDLFLTPIKKEINRLKRNKKKLWNPRMVFLLGNHEQRIERAVNADAILEDVIGYNDLNLSDWEVFEYLEPVIIGGVGFSHFFTSGVMGRPVSSAKAMITKKHMSCVMGHVQDKDIAFSRRGDGVAITGIFAGIFYQHSEGYLGHQGNNNWKGIWMLHEVENGSFDEMPVSLNFLSKKY